MKKILLTLLITSVMLSANEYVKAQSKCEKILNKSESIFNKSNREASRYKYKNPTIGMQQAQYFMTKYQACLTKILIDFK